MGAHSVRGMGNINIKREKKNSGYSLHFMHDVHDGYYLDSNSVQRLMHATLTRTFVYHCYQLLISDRVHRLQSSVRGPGVNERIDDRW